MTLPKLIKQLQELKKSNTFLEVIFSDVLLCNLSVKRPDKKNTTIHF